MGLDGIEWSTGEQQRDLYNSALRGVADEARWNPETQQLTIYKNGSLKQTIDNVPKDKLEDYIGKSGAERLLASELSKWSQNDAFRYQELLDKEMDGTLAFSETVELAKLQQRYSASNKGEGQHIATDLSIDAKWPGKLYGDFVDPMADKKFATPKEGHAYAQSIKNKTPDFDYKATVPSLLKKYGKGEFGVTSEKSLSSTEKAELEDLQSRLSLSRKEIDRLDDLKMKNTKDYLEPQQPVMWFTKDTPKSFNIYTHPATAIFGASMAEYLANKEKEK